MSTIRLNIIYSLVTEVLHLLFINTILSTLLKFRSQSEEFDKRCLQITSQN